MKRPGIFNYRIIAAIMLFCLVSVGGTAQEEPIAKHVYMIRIPATSRHKTIRQTGFRLAGRKGIITALHGVADGTTFSAYNESGDVLNNLKIASVDIDNDLALLRSPEIESRPAEGLQAVDRLTIEPGTPLRAFGHPEGINLYIKDDLRAGTPVTKKLHTVIPPNSARLFDLRKSPSANITILNISSGNIGPGFSGAPLLNSDNRVVGIVDGGLRGGALAISWAIPITAVSWRDIASASTRVNELAELETNNLFNFIEDESDRVDKELNSPTRSPAEPLDIAMDIALARDNPQGNRHAGDEPLITMVPTATGKAAHCGNPPVQPILNYWPLTFKSPAEFCHDYPLIEARLATPEGKYPSSQEELLAGLTAHAGDKIYVLVWLNNGAANRGLTPGSALARNIRLTTETDGAKGSTHFIKVAAFGDNVPSVYGRVRINTRSDERLEIVPKTGEVRNHTANKILLAGFSMGNNTIRIGDLEPDFSAGLFIRFVVQVVR
jgi:hypothetical protein